MDFALPWLVHDLEPTQPRDATAESSAMQINSEVMKLKNSSLLIAALSHQHQRKAEARFRRLEI